MIVLSLHKHFYPRAAIAAAVDNFKSHAAISILQGGSYFQVRIDFPLKKDVYHLSGEFTNLVLRLAQHCS